VADGHPFCTREKRKPDDSKITGLFFMPGWFSLEFAWILLCLFSISALIQAAVKL
jgi:hypothetical protein